MVAPLGTRMAAQEEELMFADAGADAYLNGTEPPHEDSGLATFNLSKDRYGGRSMKWSCYRQQSTTSYVDTFARARCQFILPGKAKVFLALTQANSATACSRNRPKMGNLRARMNEETFAKMLLVERIATVDTTFLEICYQLLVLKQRRNTWD